MSESLLKNTELLGDLFLIFVGVVVVFFVASVVYAIVKAHYAKKRNSFAKAKLDLTKRYYEKRNNVEECLDTEIEGQVEYKEKLEKQKDAEMDSLNTLEQKYNRLYNRCDGIIENIFAVLLAIFILTVVLLCIVCSNIGGNFSDIKKINGVESESIQATAYYEIEYEGVSQKTITVFVKNNSDKTLYNASIVEVNSGVEQDILTLDPNEEKIVSFNVYSDDDCNYEFKIENVEFKE